MEAHFENFRKHIIGQDVQFETPYGSKRLIYADWIASGRLYGPIEDRMHNEIMPFCANTHTETTLTGTVMTRAYAEAKNYIKEQVHAGEDDMLVFCGSGMTAAICKLQRIMGLRIPERLKSYMKTGAKIDLCDDDHKPVVFITHMEHHSNHTSWLETIADVEIIEADEDGLISFDHFDELLERYASRKLKIASVTACSNVTGICTDYKRIARRIHQADGYCFVDFACSGPYVNMDMHPSEEGEHLDAIFISPHKFLGGPGTSGVLVFNKKLYENSSPDIPGGGTVTFTNPWDRHIYVQNIESREDGGTPPFLQGIKAALAFKLKAEMGVENIEKREKQLVATAMDRLQAMSGLHILAPHQKERLGCISFFIDGMHFNLAVRLLNDRFGIQVRGGCACAGTYGHYLLNIDQTASTNIIRRLSKGELDARPGWVRLSLHPTMTDQELQFILDAIEYIADNKTELSKDYTYNAKKNIYIHNSGEGDLFEENILRGFYSDLSDGIQV